MIILLFEDKIKDRSSKSTEKKTIVNMKEYINNGIKEEIITEKSFTQENVLIKQTQNILKNDGVEKIILDVKSGKQNMNKLGLVYIVELNRFLDTFTGSDKYFRQAVNNKQTWQIKEFCIDMEKHAKEIGAQSMLQLVNDISLLFVYDKLDMLPVYTNKYHLELTKLIGKIKSYLN